nr:putative holin-like toxin [uncultured Granulicatella sp.]
MIERRGLELTAFEVVQILFLFGTFVIALIGLCYKIFKNQNKK